MQAVVYQTISATDASLTPGDEPMIHSVIHLFWIQTSFSYSPKKG